MKEGREHLQWFSIASGNKEKPLCLKVKIFAFLFSLSFLTHITMVSTGTTKLFFSLCTILFLSPLRLSGMPPIPSQNLSFSYSHLKPLSLKESLLNLFTNYSLGHESTASFLIKLIVIFIIKTLQHALAGVAQWIEHQPANQRVTGLIPSQGPCLGCWPGSQ